MKNKLTDLNDHLFAQLERLCDEDLVGDKLVMEIDRSKAVTSVASAVINNAKLAFDVAVALHEMKIDKLPVMISDPKETVKS